MDDACSSGGSDDGDKHVLFKRLFSQTSDSHVIAVAPKRPTRIRGKRSSPSRTPTAALRDEPLLRHSAAAFMTKITDDEKNHLRTHLGSLGNTLQISSSCSGSEVVWVALHYLMKALDFDCRLDHLFSCEKEVPKQRWIHEVMRPLFAAGAKSACVFKDIGGLCNEMCECAVHGRCQVAFSRLHVSGFSCKDLSKLNKARDAGRSSLPDRSGTSGATLDALMRFVTAHMPPILVMENVDDLLSHTSSNFAFLLNELESRGYQADAAELCSMDYFVPQRRKRCYVIAYLVLPGWEGRAVATQARRAVALTNRLVHSRAATSLNSFLLPESHAYVRSELERRTQARSAASKEQEQREELWKEQYQKELAKQQVPVSECVVPLIDRGGPWYPLLTPRQKVVLGHSILTNSSMTSADIYQSIGREFVSSDPNVVSTIVPNSLKRLRSLRRPLLGYEALKLQAFPDAVIEKGVAEDFSDCQLMDLAGNSFTGTVAQAVALAALVYAPLPCEGGRVDNQQVSIDSVADLLDL